MSIEISVNIAEDLLIKGYKLVSSNMFKINANIVPDVCDFINYYNYLEIDKYVLEKENIPYRKRRYGSYTLFSNNLKLLELKINKHSAFYQSKELNKKYGGIERKFAPIEEKILNNKFLQQLILNNFKKLPQEELKKSSKWFIGVQLFRIETTKDYIGYPSPEGIHQDGHNFVIQHLIHKKMLLEGKVYYIN